MSAASATGRRADTEQPAILNQVLRGAFGGLLRAVAAAVFVGGVHFAAHFIFGDPATFAEAGVTPAGIAASIAGALAVILL